jgi:hypothetical protein
MDIFRFYFADFTTATLRFGTKWRTPTTTKVCLTVRKKIEKFTDRRHSKVGTVEVFFVWQWIRTFWSVGLSTILSACGTDIEISNFCVDSKIDTATWSTECRSTTSTSLSAAHTTQQVWPVKRFLSFSASTSWQNAERGFTFNSRFLNDIRCWN